VHDNLITLHGLFREQAEEQVQSYIIYYPTEGNETLEAMKGMQIGFYIYIGTLVC